MPDGRGRSLSGGATAGEGRFLCRLDEIGDPGSRGFEGIPGAAPFFVVRRGAGVFAYRNVCPHYGAPLDWKPDAFLNPGRDRILCSMHGALFDVASGICTRGPCAGEALTTVRVTVRGGAVYLPPPSGDLATEPVRPDNPRVS